MMGPQNRLGKATVAGDLLANYNSELKCSKLPVWKHAEGGGTTVVIVLFTFCEAL